MEKEYDPTLNKIVIPLAELRVQVVQLMKDGYTEYPLGDFLYLLKAIRRVEDAPTGDAAK